MYQLYVLHYEYGMIQFYQPMDLLGCLKTLTDVYSKGGNETFAMIPEGYKLVKE